jgi:hypothetical protein
MPWPLATAHVLHTHFPLLIALLLLLCIQANLPILLNKNKDQQGQ